MNIHLQLQTQIAYDLLRLRLEGTIAHLQWQENRKWQWRLENHCMWQGLFARDGRYKVLKFCEGKRREECPCKSCETHLKKLAMIQNRSFPGMSWKGGKEKKKKKTSYTKPRLDWVGTKISVRSISHHHGITQKLSRQAINNSRQAVVKTIGQISVKQIIYGQTLYVRLAELAAPRIPMWKCRIFILVPFVKCTNYVIIIYSTRTKKNRG